MYKIQSIKNKVVVFEQHLSGGNLPNGFESVLTIEMDFAGATESQLLACCCSTSAKVTLANKLRNKKPEDIRKLELAGIYKVKFLDVIAKGGGSTFPISYKDQIIALGKELGTTQIMADAKVIKEVAEKYWNKITS